MSVRTFFRGVADEPDHEERHAAELRRARLSAARGMPLWTELDELDLVPRDPYLVHAETDELYKRSRGVAFAPGTATVVATNTRLGFYVDGDGELVFVEPVPGTWTGYLERQAARERRRNARRPRPAWMEDAAR